ncbi:putative glycosyl transferase-like [Trypanosoma grayi]|uniref:putative glycosyl transferase-like n=1 Tax=Trypanosoma grayi TaxID=71804 RepID=UPI0004F4B9A0|nr:putative glycosyl transferase-like [Trypanosoma grayi]KEG11157.1 putative glycosyl transferase-like [Trypanosoma grayi]
MAFLFGLSCGTPQRRITSPLHTSLETGGDNVARGPVNDVHAPIVKFESHGDSCVQSTVEMYTRYAADAAEAKKTRDERGPLRIAAFSRLWIPPLHATGGMQFHAYHIYSQLAARGHYVHVFVTGPPSGQLQKLGYCTDPDTNKTSLCGLDKARLVVEQVASKHNSAYSVKWLEECLSVFQRYHEAQPFHLVHSESWAAVPNMYQLGLPFAVTWHGSMLDWLRSELNYIAHNYRMMRKMPGPNVMERMKSLSSVVTLEEYMLLTVPQHIVISDEAEKNLREIQHIVPDQIALIYNGVDRHMFRPREGQEVRNAFLDEYRVPRNHFIVGCGGRLEAIKGHLQLSKAMRLIMGTHHDVTLMVAGRGSQGQLYGSMRREGMPVIQLGMLSQENLARFYQTVDVFVDPFYQHHGLNTVMIEAALSGVPLVVTDLGSARSVVPCAEYGRRFTLGDVEGLAREILHYKFHPEEGEAAARRSRERAMQLFGSDTMASRYERVFYRLVRSPPPLEKVTGSLECTSAYPAMCYRKLV